MWVSLYQMLQVNTSLSYLWEKLWSPCVWCCFHNFTYNFMVSYFSLPSKFFGFFFFWFHYFIFFFLLPLSFIEVCAWAGNSKRQRKPVNLKRKHLCYILQTPLKHKNLTWFCWLLSELVYMDHICSFVHISKFLVTQWEKETAIL